MSLLYFKWMKSFLILTFFTLVFCNLAQARQRARVATVRAVVYADKELQAPIGYIPNGKMIMVGTKRRKRGTIVPIVVAHRIAWVQVKDLALETADGEVEDTQKITEHRIENIIKEEDEDSILDNNHLNFDYGQMLAGTDWKKLAEEVGDRTNVPISYFHIMAEHRPPFRRIHFGIGASYYKLESDILTALGYPAPYAVEDTSTDVTAEPKNKR